MENNKLIKSATVIDRILKIFQGFAIAGMVVAAIFIPLSLIFGDKIIAKADKLTLDALDLELSGDLSAYLNMANVKSSIVVMLIGMILMAAAVWFCLRVLREILAPMKEGQPFASGIADKIRKLGWTVLVAGAISEIGGMLNAVFELRMYQLEKIVNPALVSEISYDYSFNIGFVFVALIIFFLSYVFRYGEALQKESDETL
ncbi:MAG: DUF2975 domain-containing protein [Firmicutes bacterium]|nr:DUF2975 domain-containing protein [Bacillota bacterium]